MRINNKNKNVLLRFFILLSFCLGLPVLAEAKVIGACANCHTMHNSQDGAAQVHISTGSSVRWSGDGGVLVGPLGSPQPQLLKTNCVGCHSSADSATIVTVGITRIPIVWNIGGSGGTDLAGGNFSYVFADEGKGHNVLGISPVSVLAQAPGNEKGCAKSCHISLVSPNDSDKADNKTGCEGCHLYTGHHDAASDAPTPGPTGGGGDAYRFLGGHGSNASTWVFNGANENFEDSFPSGAGWKGDWGKTTSPSNVGGGDYNVYQAGSDNTAPMTIGRFCAGCHSLFHAYGFVSGLNPLSTNLGDRDNEVGSGWLRHPTNVELPEGVFAGEFESIKDTPYNPDVPLGRSTAQRGFPIKGSDQVICLSCHKAHGTQYADALRFSYSTMTAHTSPGRTDGCFFCHRAKS